MFVHGLVFSCDFVLQFPWRLDLCTVFANLEFIGKMSDWITIPLAEETIRDQMRESLRAVLTKGTIRSRKVYEDGEAIDFDPIYWMYEGKLGDEAEIDDDSYAYTIEVNRDDLLNWLSHQIFGQ